MKIAALLVVVPLFGCAVTAGPEVTPIRKPVSEMTPQERCANLLELAGNPYLTGPQQRAAYEKARNDGCMGQPRPLTVIIH